MKNKKDFFKEKYGAIAAWIGIIAGTYLVVVAVLVYAFSMSDSRILRKTLAIIPYPAAIAGGRIITLNKLFNLSDSVKLFYENQDFSAMGLRVDFNSSDGEKRLKIKEKNVLTKLIENSIIETEAKKAGIKITDEMADQELARKLKEYGSEDELKSTLKKLYGWEVEDFKENIVKPDLYRVQMFEQMKTQDDSRDAAKKKIEEAASEIKSSSFSSIAEKYSDGESAKSGGELGWFTADQMLPDVALAAFSLKKGGRSDVVESPIGYHIIEIMDKKTENEKDMVKVRQIFVRAKSFSDWLAEKENNAIIVNFIPGYQWDKQTHQVGFEDADMQKFEQEQINNAYNDASILF